MRSIKAVMRAIAGGLILAAMADSSPTTAQTDGAADAAAGRALASKMCARCHAIERQGASPLRNAPPFRTFATKWPLENLEEALAEGIVVGHKDMPEFELTPPQIDDLIAHLRAVQTK